MKMYITFYSNLDHFRKNLGYPFETFNKNIIFFLVVQVSTGYEYTKVVSNIYMGMYVCYGKGTLAFALRHSFCSEEHKLALSPNAIVY